MYRVRCTDCGWEGKREDNILRSCPICNKVVKQVIIRSPKGIVRRTVNIESVQIPDLWHIAMWLQDNESKIKIHNHLVGQSLSEAVLETWNLCYDLLINLKGEE